jgi:tRNA threonylcarbamoyladenosine biosynthesis protein TsaE
MPAEVFVSTSVDETRAHAARFATQARAGMVLRLHGDLGAGKTTWLQGLVAALQSPEPVTSPTFALLHEYRDGQLPVFHWDLYRLNPETNWDLLDLPEHLPSQGLTVIEWSERYPGPWPAKDCLDINIKIDANNRRQITITS